MAVVGKSGLGKFFIYDHNKLKKEEDDLIDAILYFYPLTVSADEQCSLCGQLMGMSEFLSSTLSQSAPRFFKLQNEKYCLKKIGHFSMGLEGSLGESDYHIQTQLDFLYHCFVMFCGSFQNILQQFIHNSEGFTSELRKIWNVLYPLACFNNNYVSQVFEVLPMVHLPKSSSDLFCQAADILQGSQRRPGVHVGAILYKNRVLCTQMPTELTRKLSLVKPELPCIQSKTDFDISRSVRLISVYLTEKEMKSINKTFKPSQRHCRTSKFVWQDQATHRSTLSCGRHSVSPYPRNLMRMESIPERSNNEATNLSDGKTKLQKFNQNNLIWTTNDEVEKNKYQTRKESNSENRMETISDLEDSSNGASKSSNSVTEEKQTHDNSQLVETGIMTSDESCEATNVTIEALVHRKFSESLEKSLDLSKDKYPDVKIEKSVSPISENSNNHLNVNNVKDKSDETFIDDEKMLKHDLSLDKDLETDRKGSSPGYNTQESQCFKVDCLNECSCGCDISSSKDVGNKKDGVLISQTNQIKRTDASSIVEESETIATPLTDDDDVFVDRPQIEIDGFSHSCQLEQLISETQSEKGQLMSQTEQDISEDSESIDGSVSDVASLSTSRRKERFDFVSSADESSSEYGSYVSKRASLDYSNKKFNKLFQLSENDGIDSNNTSFQSTLNSSGTLSALSSLDSPPRKKEEDEKQFWEPGHDNLYEMTLYVQGRAANHSSSDITLLLLMDCSLNGNKDVVHSLWKDALPQLADLDFYVKESVDQHVDEGFMETSSYLKYDCLFHKIEGNELDVPVNEDFQKLAGEIHKDYQKSEDITSIALTNHLCSCNSSRDRTNELYYHVDSQNSNK